MIAEDYVSFETAKLLKEKGFNEDSWFHYDADGDIVTRGYRLNMPEDIPAWTLQMAMKWLREVHNILIVDALSMAVGGKLIYEKRILEFSPTPIGSCENPFNLIHKVIGNTPEEAGEAAIRYCLENLI